MSDRFTGSVSLYFPHLEVNSFLVANIAHTENPMIPDNTYPIKRDWLITATVKAPDKSRKTENTFFPKLVEKLETSLKEIEKEAEIFLLE